MPSPLAIRPEVRHFRHSEMPFVTHFGASGMHTPDGILTLIIRTDAQFATRSLQAVFKTGGFELLHDRRSDLSTEHFSQLVETAYAAWGREIIAALAGNLDYEDRYFLPPSHTSTHVHFHTADSLAQSIIHKACDLLQREHAEKPEALFISLDDMIHADLFQHSVMPGQFEEIGFSRLFSRFGEELDFVGRPGHPSIEKQIGSVANKLKEMRGNNAHRVPIILLEDNVRRSKTLLWIFEKMEQGDIFVHGELAGIATCFSVATPEERAKISYEGKEIPLAVGVDYTNSLVDVVTPRDHFFDGFVTQRYDGSFGRLPSFMLSDSRIADNFKINPLLVSGFRNQIIDANRTFCETIQNQAGVVLPLEAFTPGATIAEIMDVSPQTPMVNILHHVKDHGVTTLRPL